MLTYNEFLNQNISEEIHPELNEILNSEKYSVYSKLDKFFSAIKHLDEDGVDTGLGTAEHKDGSSRVMFSSDVHPKIILDGQEVELPTLHKVAIYGKMDRYKEPDESLLGDDQNELESNYKVNSAFGTIQPNDDGFSSNPNGVLPPLLYAHPKFHHIEMGLATDMSDNDFSRLTKNAEFPNGLTFDQFHTAMKKEYDDAHGLDIRPSYEFDKQDLGNMEELHDNIMKHPFVNNVYKMILSSTMHPRDCNLSTLGIWTHPITHKEYPVVRDYGYSTKIVKKYLDLKKRSKYK